jgi:hypothetical protein
MLLLNNKPKKTWKCSVAFTARPEEGDVFEKSKTCELEQAEKMIKFIFVPTNALVELKGGNKSSKRIQKRTEKELQRRWTKMRMKATLALWSRADHFDRTLSLSLFSVNNEIAASNKKRIERHFLNASY